MADKKNLCAQIDTALHMRVCGRSRNDPDKHSANS